jgi:two-component system alkaline phosphatase synthesis response regulator PhoP
MSQAVILVVEDEEDIRELCRANLEYEGYEVIEATNGKEALELLDQKVPDLILLDLMMPEVDGWEVLDKIKKKEEMAGVPVVLVTARQDLKSQLQGWQAQISDYLTKPFSPTALTAFVKRALGETDSSDEAERRQTIIEGLKLLEEFGGETEGGDEN